MGMFDWINYYMKCPMCGHMIEGFQSKDGECTLDELEIDTVDHFYSDCDKCNTWYSFTKINGVFMPNIEINKEQLQTIFFTEDL